MKSENYHHDNSNRLDWQTGLAGGRHNGFGHRMAVVRSVNSGPVRGVLPTNVKLLLFLRDIFHREKPDAGTEIISPPQVQRTVVYTQTLSPSHILFL